MRLGQNDRQQLSAASHLRVPWPEIPLFPTRVRRRAPSAASAVRHLRRSAIRMETLKQILQSVLAHVTFDPDWAAAAVGMVMRKPEEHVAPGRLRRLHASACWRNDEWRRIRHAIPTIPAPLRARLIACLRQILDAWLDADGRIGHAFPAGRVGNSSAAQNGDVWDVQYVSSLESFAEGLVRGAVILGIERVCSHLADWTRGASVPLRITGILDSLALDRPVSPGRGIRVEPLPAASDQLPADLPDRPGLAHYAYLSRTLVSVDAEAAPALFHPQDPAAAAGAVRTTLKADLSVEDISKALSLLCDESHPPAFLWHDQGKLAALGPLGHGWEYDGTGQLGVLRHTDRLRYDPNTAAVTLDRQTRNLDDKRLRRLVAGMGSCDRSVQIAMDRWMRAKGGRTDPADRLIDMRIALESLFLPNDQRGARLSLALYGAWYLGPGPQERKELFEKFRRAYGAGSGAVHRGEVVDDARGRVALADGLDLCRQGILKMLTEGSPAPWPDMVLGVDTRRGESGL